MLVSIGAPACLGGRRGVEQGRSSWKLMLASGRIVERVKLSRMPEQQPAVAEQQQQHTAGHKTPTDCSNLGKGGRRWSRA